MYSGLASGGRRNGTFAQPGAGASIAASSPGPAEAWLEMLKLRLTKSGQALYYETTITLLDAKKPLG